MVFFNVVIFFFCGRILFNILIKVLCWFFSSGLIVFGSGIVDDEVDFLDEGIIFLIEIIKFVVEIVILEGLIISFFLDE